MIYPHECLLIIKNKHFKPHLPRRKVGLRQVQSHIQEEPSVMKQPSMDTNASLVNSKEDFFFFFPHVILPLKISVVFFLHRAENCYTEPFYGLM